MPSYTQAYRPLRVVTPLGPDAMLLVSFSGEEAISELFCFQLELLVPNGQKVSFEELLGKPATVALRLPKSKQRYFAGIVKRVSQGERDTDFTAYYLEVVPQFWLLTRRVQSRIFQQISVPDILKQVLSGLNVDFRIQGSFHKRDYCVQYGESDFAFASRLMEEEGIYYYFTHSDGSHKLVLANTPQGHSNVPQESSAIFDHMTGGNRPEDRVFAWRKTQELRSGKVTLRDHCFELTGQNLSAEAGTPESVQVGKVTHKLKVGANGSLELYGYPGRYAQRFDGVDPGGGDRSSELQKIFDDNQRTAKIRMQEEALHSLAVQGQSTCGQFTAGHRFQLTKHFDGDGQYVLTRVRHAGRNGGDYRSDGEGDFSYENQFTSIPQDLAYRPERKTPKPVVHGTQTAVVVGPKGEEIFTDKYGRVKVQFPWDREGKFDAGSSCWVRVASNSAGKKWGSFIIPRIGHEVVVAFEEGDPDRPIIVGNVYNDHNPPPVDMPSKRMISGMRSATYPGSGGYNMMTMDDTKGKELIQVHGQYDMDSTIEHDLREHVLNDRARDVTNNETITIGVDRTETVGNNESLTVGVDRTMVIGSNNSDSIASNDTKLVGVNQTITVSANQAVTVGANQTNSVGSSQNESVGMFRSASIGMVDSTNAGLIETISAGLVVAISAGVTLTLAGPGGTIVIGPSGIELKGKKIIIKGDTVHINP